MKCLKMLLRNKIMHTLKNNWAVWKWFDRKRINAIAVFIYAVSKKDT